MLDDNDLAAVEARLTEASGERWELGTDETGLPLILVRFQDGHSEEMRVKRDFELAGEADVRFIAHARSDASRLIAAIRGSSSMSATDLDAIERRAAAASPEPWTAFIEAEGGLAGTDVIRVTDRDDEPDLYLWLGSDLAPSSDFRFVASARQDIPRLVAALRRPET